MVEELLEEFPMNATDLNTTFCLHTTHVKAPGHFRSHCSQHPLQATCPHSPTNGSLGRSLHTLHSTPLGALRLGDDFFFFRSLDRDVVEANAAAARFFLISAARPSASTCDEQE